MKRHYFGLSTLLASVALLIWSIGETFAFPQGPNVSMGTNPVESIFCVNTSFTYTVPAGQRLIITDISLQLSSGNSADLQSNSVTVWRTRGSNSTPIQHVHLNSGIPFEENEVLSCTGQMSLSGYLAHQ